MKFTPEQAMQRAIDEAKKGSGFVSPNPLVGCVILDSDFEYVSSGYHARCGEAHAEVQALNNVKDEEKLKGAHVFVTLEPCAHHGRTPPCAEALAKLPIASVTYGLKDPNPLVAGRGLEILERAGIAIQSMPEFWEQLEDLAEIFLLNMREQRPFVAVKVATSLDGQMAMRSGESQWITSEAARAHVQTLRGAYDAVMVGIGTFLGDDPKLNSRDPQFEKKRQRAVLLDPDGKSFSKLIQSALLKVRNPEDLFIVTNPGVQSPNVVGVHHIQAEMTREHWNWSEIFRQLYVRDVRSILVEGGGFVYADLLRHKKVDRIYSYVAAKILGAGGGIPWTKGLAFDNLSSVPTLSRVRHQIFGPDVLITGRLLHRNP